MLRKPNAPQQLSPINQQSRHYVKKGTNPVGRSASPPSPLGNVVLRGTTCFPISLSAKIGFEFIYRFSPPNATTGCWRGTTHRWSGLAGYSCQCYSFPAPWPSPVRGRRVAQFTAVVWSCRAYGNCSPGQKSRHPSWNASELILISSKPRLATETYPAAPREISVGDTSSSECRGDETST